MKTYGPNRCSFAPAFSSMIALVFSLIFVSSASADLGQLYREAEKLNNQEKVKQSSASLADMQSALKFTLQELQASYDKKDVIQTNCIKDNINWIKECFLKDWQTVKNNCAVPLSTACDCVAREQTGFAFIEKPVKLQAAKP